MILGAATSINGIKIRLTKERWMHITTSHIEIDPDDYKTVLDVVKNPDVIFKGDVGELLAVKKQPGKKFWTVVPYKELGRIDGFILTAYHTTDSSWLFKNEIIWSKE